MARVHEYDGDGIRVRYDVARCIHAAECVRGLPAVFDPDARPWIRPAAAENDRIAAVIERCPTGALTYTRTDGGEAEAAPPAAVLSVLPDGPVAVHADVRLTAADGTTTKRFLRLALCRCGASSAKPFCDGSHTRAGFRPDSGTDADTGPDAGETT